MTANADDTTTPLDTPSAATQADNPAADTAAPAPRRRRSVKAETAADPATEPGIQASEPPASPPKRRRAAVKKVDAVPAEAQALPADPAEQVPAAERPEVAKPTDGVEARQKEPAPANRPEPAPGGDAAPAVEADSAAPAAADAHGPADAAAEPGDSESQARAERGRRRRNRKDRPHSDRGESAQAGGEAGGAVPARLAPAVGDLFAKLQSGDFDTEQEGVEEEAPPAHKRVLAPEPDAPKLHKVLAQAGVGSRRDMEELILEGRISVNGEPAHIGQRISFGDEIKVAGKVVKVRITPPPPRVLAYHKPVGEVVTHDDPQHRPTVFRRLPRLPHGKWQSVGRLDLNTEGLLLFTNSGELANQLMHPRFGIEREYAVRVLGELTADAKARLLEGVKIDGQSASFRSIEEGGGDGANRWYRVVITEGRNREVRRLFEAVGLTVSRLIRIRYGCVVLPLGLKRGVWVDLDEGDVRAIRRLAGADNGHGRGEQRQGGDKPPRNDRHGPRSKGRGGRAESPRRDNPADTPVREQGEHDADSDLDLDHGPIPNPLEQTFDKRFVTSPRSSVGGRGFSRGGGGFGSGGSGPGPAGGSKKGGPRQPDPLQTSVGYLGADAFHRRGPKGGGGRGGGGQGGGQGGGFGGSFGGGGRRGR